MVYMLVLIIKPSLALTPEENEAQQVDQLAQFSQLGWSRIHTCVWPGAKAQHPPGLSPSSVTLRNPCFTPSLLCHQSFKHLNLKLRHPLAWRCGRVWPCHSEPATLARVMLTPKTV